MRPGSERYAAIEKRDDALPPDDRLQLRCEVVPYRDGRIGDFCGIGAGADTLRQSSDYPMRWRPFQECALSSRSCVSDEALCYSVFR